MRIIKTIIKIVKGIINMPVTIMQVKNSMVRVESKLDFIIQYLHESNSTKSTIHHVEQDRLRTCEDGIILKIEEYLAKELSSLTVTFNQKFENQFIQLESLSSLYNSLPNLKFLPATRGWAGSPDFLAKISELILKGKPNCVLEAGSGLSTIIIGSALRLNNNGKLISLEHDRFYANITKENLDINGISQIADVKYCPLKDYTDFDQSWKWYDNENLNLINKIDMLVIDGPPGATQLLARYPAVLLLHEHFSDRTLILLDDANRTDESIIVQKWVTFLESNNFNVVVTQYNNFEKGLVILEVLR